MECKNSAGFWIRLGAGFVDGLIIAAVTAILSNLIYGEYITENFFNPLDLLGNLYMIILPVIWYGYTIGKWVAGIRIVRVDGQRTGIGTMSSQRTNRAVNLCSDIWHSFNCQYIYGGIKRR